MKLKMMIMSLVTLASQVAMADSEFASGFTPISPESFRARLYMKGELLVTDATGKILKSPTSDIRIWRAGVKSKKIESDWITKAGGIRDVNVHFEFDVHDDKSISATIKQYDSMKNHIDKKAKDGKIIREQTFDIENFAGISWVAETGKDYRVILRFTPTLDNMRENGDLDKLTIGGDTGNFLVTDNQGYMWGDNVRMGGVISGMNSHRGSFVISYYPFKGAKKMGHAIGKNVELDLTDKLKVTARCSENILPDGVQVNVYGKYLPDFKSEGVNSVWSFGQMTVDQVPKEFGL